MLLGWAGRHTSPGYNADEGFAHGSLRDLQGRFLVITWRLECPHGRSGALVK